jgi:asparagine synthase (glutamine-hydrolysing)
LSTTARSINGRFACFTELRTCWGVEMGAQAGFIRFDRELPVPFSAAAALPLLREFGNDAEGAFADDDVLMVASTRSISRCELGQSQPFRSRDGLVVTWDGRLDNRRDLLLALWTRLGSDAPDVAIAAAAYNQWGCECFRRLCGDWSIVIWDRKTSVVTIASDYMGTRDVFYYTSRHAFCWSTDIEVLLRTCARDCDIDREYIAGMLTIGPPPGHTPYKSITPMAAGHAMQVSVSGRQTISRFYSFGGTSIRCTRPQDYEELLRDRFVDAIECRLRSRAPVWCDLSGGLDSSSVVCAASALVTQRAVECPRVETFSCHRPDSPESDERQFIEAVEQQCNLRTHYFVMDDSSIGACERPVPEFRLTPRLECERVMREMGSHTLVSGRLGDTLMRNVWDDSARIVETLMGAHLLRFWREALSWSRALRQPMVLTICGALQLLRSSAPSRRPVTPGTESRTPLQIYSVSPSLTTHPEDLHPDYAQLARDSGTRGQRPLLTLLWRHSLTRALSAYVTSQDVTHTFPFAHRPLVEAVLAMPYEVLSEPGLPRALMRRSFGGFWPHAIAQRPSKAHASPALLRAVKPTAKRMLHGLDSLMVIDLGFVDRAAFRGRLQTLLDGGCREIGNLLWIALCEEWLRHHHNNKRASVEARPPLETLPRRGGENYGVPGTQTAPCG